MSQPLFDKTYDELREAFVRARFAEPAVFGRSDIEAWLEAWQSPFQSLDQIEGWRARRFHEYLEADGASTHEQFGNLLRELVTPVDELPDWFGANLDHEEKLTILLQTLKLGGATIFCPDFEDHDRVVVIRTQNDTFALVHSQYDSLDPVSIFAQLRRARRREIVDLLFDEWMFDRPKAAQALAFLKAEYREAIKREREAAQRDFDQACAVSADGTKIVHASWVFVAEGSEPTSGLLFPASAFHRNKIRCGQRISHTIAHLDIERQLEQSSFDRGFLGYLCGNWMDWNVEKKAVLVSGSKHRDILKPIEKTLLVGTAYCPSPLPDGGREIRV